MTTELKPYSVMLEYPDYMEGGTYYAFVSAPSPAAAVSKARAECMAENWDPHEDTSLIYGPGDLDVLLCIEGHHNDVTP